MRAQLGFRKPAYLGRISKFEPSSTLLVGAMDISKGVEREILARIRGRNQQLIYRLVCNRWKDIFENTLFWKPPENFKIKTWNETRTVESRITDRIQTKSLKPGHIWQLHYDRAPMTGTGVITDVIYHGDSDSHSAGDVTIEYINCILYWKDFGLDISMLKHEYDETFPKVCTCEEGEYLAEEYCNCGFETTRVDFWEKFKKENEGNKSEKYVKYRVTYPGPNTKQRNYSKAIFEQWHYVDVVGRPGESSLYYMIQNWD